MGSGKVLVIDDEKLLVRSTCMMLNAYGYDALGALDGEAGLKAAVEFAPDVILLDIMMPGMDGWQVLEKLKQSEATRRIPVFIFTAREYSNGKALAVEKGAEDFIAKPFEPEDLATMLENQLRSSREKK